MTAELLHVAIAGSGPAGYYTAEALARAPHVRVDILDRLPTPFGLIRGGVAPDHQSIKQVARRYEQTALMDNVRFLGNLAIGRDVSVEELLGLYDAVVIATGAAKDRPLGIPGEDLKGVWGAGAFVGWYNSHPDHVDLDIVTRVASVAVIGNGNVALDVARVLAKTADEMADSDLDEHAAREIHGAPIRDIYIFGRRGPAQVSFTPKELGELDHLARCVPLADAAQFPPQEEDAALPPGQRRVVGLLRGFAGNRPDTKPVRLHFVFHARPARVVGSDRVCALELERTRIEEGRAVGTGERFEVPCGLVVSCIGYRSSPIPGVPYDESRGLFPNQDGLIAERLYAVGWARRGPSGTIGTNKPDGAEIAARILAEVEPTGRPGRAGLDALIAGRGLDCVTFRDWQRIDAAELAAARDRHPRLKFRHIEDMLAALHATGGDPGGSRRS